MRISGRVFFPLIATIIATTGFAIPHLALAAGTSDGAAKGATSTAASPQPKPAESKKIWTNDDFPSAAAQTFQAIPDAGSAQAASSLPMTTNQPTASALLTSSASEPVNAAQNPRWYAQQAGSIESELANIEAKEQQLRDFRATGKGLQTGLNIAAPCEGVGTDQYIAQLDARRQELLQQMDSLEDMARSNGLPPGILVEGRGRVDAQEQMTPAEQQMDIVEKLHDRSAQLQETEDTLAAMQADAASRGITLQAPAIPNATSQTANLLGQLSDQASELQNDISNDEDDARHAGVDPNQLP